MEKHQNSAEPLALYRQFIAKTIFVAVTAPTRLTFSFNFTFKSHFSFNPDTAH